MTEPQPIRFEVDSSKQLRLAIFSGVITESILFQAYEQLLSAPDYEPTLDDLVDMRGVERLGISSQAVRHLVGLFAQPESQAANKLAIVASAAHIFGMARMYEILSSNTSEQIQVFRDLREAEHWLNIVPADETQ
jgi:hypothetical protein